MIELGAIGLKSYRSHRKSHDPEPLPPILPGFSILQTTVAFVMSPAKPAPSPPSSAPSNVATSFPNITFTINSNIRGRDKDFLVTMDPGVTRNGQPAVLLSSATPQWGINGDATRPIDVTPFLGKRMRFSARCAPINTFARVPCELWCEWEITSRIATTAPA